MDRTANQARKGDLVSLALELQALESETFEIQDYVEINEMSAAALAPSATSTSSCSTSSTCSTTSCCA